MMGIICRRFYRWFFVVGLLFVVVSSKPAISFYQRRITPAIVKDVSDQMHTHRLYHIIRTATTGTALFGCYEKFYSHINIRVKSQQIPVLFFERYCNYTDAEKVNCYRGPDSYRDSLTDFKILCPQLPTTNHQLFPGSSYQKTHSTATPYSQSLLSPGCPAVPVQFLYNSSAHPVSPVPYCLA